MAIGKEYILVRNQVRDGDIFIFDRTGKGVTKINRMGQGTEEYVWNYEVFLDENNEEIFVCDNSIKNITHLKSFSLPFSTTVHYRKVTLQATSGGLVTSAGGRDRWGSE